MKPYLEYSCGCKWG